MYPPNVEQCSHTEGVVTPLVCARDQSCDEASDDKDNAHEEGGEYVGERKAGGKEELKEQKRECDEPLDVSHELTVT